jgi:hypothetical protein
MPLRALPPVRSPLRVSPQVVSTNGVLSGELHASVSIALVMPERGGKCTKGSVVGRVVVFGAILSRQFGDRRRDPVGCAFLRARAVLEGRRAVACSSQRSLKGAGSC